MQCDGWRVWITGASSGIGRATALLFAKAGAKLLLISRRRDALSSLATELQSNYGVEADVVALDVRDRQAVANVCQALPAVWQSVDVLVNNAGLALGLDSLDQGDIDQWEQMIDTNIKGVLYITRFVLKQMLARQRGHIISVGSVSAYQRYAGGVVYCATKSALCAITDGIKVDVHGTPIRTTIINPGMVNTEFSMTRFAGDQQKADDVYQGMAPLSAEDVADAIVYAATRPPHVDVREMLIMPTAQTASHLVYREPSLP